MVEPAPTPRPTRPWAWLSGPRARGATRVCAAVVAGLLGGTLAVAVAGGISHQLGPLDVHLQVRLAAHGGTTVQVAPLGSLHLNSHDGPLRLSARVTDVRPQAADGASGGSEGFARRGCREP